MRLDAGSGAGHRLAESLGAGVLPALLLLRRGEQPVAYTGPHAAAAIQAYAEKQLRAAVARCRTEADVALFLSRAGVGGTGAGTLALGFFRPVACAPFLSCEL